MIFIHDSYLLSLVITPFICIVYLFCSGCFVSFSIYLILTCCFVNPCAVYLTYRLLAFTHDSVSYSCLSPFSCPQSLRFSSLDPFIHESCLYYTRNSLFLLTAVCLISLCTLAWLLSLHFAIPTIHDSVLSSLVMFLSLCLPCILVLSTLFLAFPSYTLLNILTIHDSVLLTLPSSIFFSLQCLTSIHCVHCLVTCRLTLQRHTILPFPFVLPFKRHPFYILFFLSAFLSYNKPSPTSFLL